MSSGTGAKPACGCRPRVVGAMAPVAAGPGGEKSGAMAAAAMAASSKGSPPPPPSPFSAVSAFPSGYGFVVLTAIGSVMLVTWKSIKVGQARQEHKIPYPALYSPDNMAFNCIQSTMLSICRDDRFFRQK